MRNLLDLEKEVEKRYKRREKKKKMNFKVSGKEIFKLKELLKKKKS